MNTSSEHLTRKEEQELSDERVLSDIRQSIRAREESGIPADIDIRALAVLGVEQFWAERDKLAGIGDEADSPASMPNPVDAHMARSLQPSMGDDILLSFQLASRKLAALQDRAFAEKVLPALPIIAILVVLLFFPSFPRASAKLFQNVNFAQVIGLCAVLLGCLLGFLSQRQREQWVQAGGRGLRYFAGITSGVMLGVALVIIVGLQRDNVARDIQTQEIVSTQLLDVARTTIETGRFEEGPEQPQIITLDNKKTVRVSSRKSDQGKLVYRAEGEGLPSPIEVKIDKNSGELSLLNEGGDAEKKAEFFVGKVEEVSDNKLTLSIKDEKGTVKSLSFAINSLVLKPSRGQRVFVTVDVASNTATGIEKVADDTPKSPPEDTKKEGAN